MCSWTNFCKFDQLIFTMNAFDGMVNIESISTFTFLLLLVQQVTDNQDCIARLSNKPFPSESNTGSYVLPFNASDMAVNKTYRFLLTITKDIRMSQDYIEIYATPGTTPSVS